MTLVARGNFPPKDLKELIAYVKQNKDKVTYANAGLGAASHLCGMLFMSAIDTDLTTVPYKGTGPAMNDLLGGKVDFMCDQTTNTTGQIKAGKIKVYAVTTKKRVPSLPDVPTAAEAGLPNFEVAVWHGLYAPKGTPKAIIDRLNAALKVALKDPTLKQRFADLGTEPVADSQATPEALSAHLKAQIDLVGSDHQEGRRLRRLTRGRIAETAGTRGRGVPAFLSGAVPVRGLPWCANGAPIGGGRP